MLKTAHMNNGVKAEKIMPYKNMYQVQKKAKLYTMCLTIDVNLLLSYLHIIIKKAHVKYQTDCLKIF